MQTQKILERLAECDDDLLTADGFNEAIVGVVEGWFGSSQRTVVCYDYAKCVEILVQQGCSEDEAEEYLQFNTLGAYVGPYTPVFLHNWRDED